MKPWWLLLLLYPPGGLAETLDGVLDWDRRVALGTPVSGVVTEVLVEAGAAVTAGTPMVRLEQRRYRAGLEAARLAAKAADAHLEEALRERDRTRELYDRTLLSDHELQLAEIALTEARARREEAGAQLVEARLRLEYSEIRAPFDGWVLSRPAQVGQVVASRLAPPVLVELADRTHMQAVFVVPLEALEKLRRGQTLKVSVGEAAYQGVVTEPGFQPVAGENALRYRLVIRFPLPADTLLRAGQPARVTLP